MTVLLISLSLSNFEKFFEIEVIYFKQYLRCRIELISINKKVVNVLNVMQNNLKQYFLLIETI